jgi:uncharacterized membrane protein YfcA
MLDALSQPWWAYIVVGLVCGVFSATFGVGSGIIMVPVLVLAFALPQKSAQGICLAVMVPMALVGALQYKMNPDIQVNTGAVILLAVGGMVGAYVGANLAAWLPAMTLRRLFAIVMIVAAVRLLTTKQPQPTAHALTPTATENDSSEEGGP